MSTEPRLDLTLIASLDLYFQRLGDQPPHAVHAMVIEAVERPLLRYILTRCQGNLSQAAQMLGLSRNTLRKKLKDLNLLSEPPCSHSARKP